MDHNKKVVDRLFEISPVLATFVVFADFFINLIYKPLLIAVAIKYLFF